MTKSYRLVLLLLVTAIALSGCYTIKSLSDPRRPKVYGGVRMRLETHAAADATRERLGGKFVGFIFDFPLCLIADTLLLPATVFMEPEYSEPQRPEEIEEEDDAE